jgi:hypothetical protein
MKASGSITRQGLFFLVLLLSHECISVATTVRNNIFLRKTGSHIEFAMESMKDYVDNANIDSMFIELDSEAKVSMTAAEYATFEVREVHKSLLDSYGFEGSPVMADLHALPVIGEGRILSPREVQEHQKRISSFLEKSFAQLESKIETLKPQDAQMSELLDHSKELEEAFSMSDGLGAAGFGFIDGFFSGMVTEFAHAFHDPSCHEGQEVSKSGKELILSLKGMWGKLKTIHRKVWTTEGRTQLARSFRRFLVALKSLITEVMSWVYQCALTRQLVTLFGIILGMVGLLILIPGVAIVLKVGGFLLGMFFTYKYISKAVKEIFAQVNQPGKCDKQCLEIIVEKGAGIIGAITELIFLSGMRDVIKQAPALLSKAANIGKSGVKQLKAMSLSKRATLFKDWEKLATMAKRSKSGVKVELTASREVAYNIYKAKKVKAGNTPLTMEKWVKKLQNLELGAKKFVKSKKAYKLYQAKKIKDGKTPLDYEKWVNSLKNLDKAQKALALKNYKYFVHMNPKNIFMVIRQMLSPSKFKTKALDVYDDRILRMVKKKQFHPGNHHGIGHTIEHGAHAGEKFAHHQMAVILEDDPDVHHEENHGEKGHGNNHADAEGGGDGGGHGEGRGPDEGGHDSAQEF